MVKFPDEIFATAANPRSLSRRIFPAHEFRELIARGLARPHPPEGFRRDERMRRGGV